MRTLVHMDGDDHVAHRSIVSDWFLPKNVNRYEAQLSELAARYVDHMLATSECEFTSTLSDRLPLHAVMTILGLPESDHDHILALTQRIFGVNDPSVTQTDKADSYLGAQVEFNDYFTVIAQDRRRRPTEDLSSIIANATVNGEPLQESDCLAYFMLIASAGHDTTAAAIAGGLAALLEYPDQLARLRADPTLMASAVDEMMRWVTPNKGFLRNATEDYELRGVMIRAGQSVLMSYASANFDEEQFDAPNLFDIARKPNKHLAFGFGAHFCLGAQLARIEMRTLFTELLSRIDSIELTAPVELKPTVFVGGIKQLQLRYSPA